MPVKFNQFNTGSVNMSDHIVGYSSPAPGGERRWTIQQLADSIQGIQTKGAPIQVKQVIKKDVSSVTGTPNPGIWQDIPGMSCTIAVRTLNPFFRVQAMISCAGNSNGNHGPMFRLYRTNQATLTDGVVANSLGVRDPSKPFQNQATACCTAASTVYAPNTCTIDIVDDQLTANPGNLVQYKVQWYIWSGYIAWINTGYSADSNNAYDCKAVSSLTLTELAS